MENITELISSLSELIPYYVQGYCFIRVFNFIRMKSTDSPTNLVSCVILSYCLKVIFDETIGRLAFIDDIKFGYYLLILIAFSMVLAYLIGIISQSKRVTKILRKAKIHRTMNNFWDDIAESGLWYDIHIKDSPIVYCGQITLREENERFPLIRLERYSILDAETYETLSNFDPLSKKSDVPKGEQKSIIINTSDIDYVVVTKTQMMKTM